MVVGEHPDPQRTASQLAYAAVPTGDEDVVDYGFEYSEDEKAAALEVTTPRSLFDRITPKDLFDRIERNPRHGGYQRG